MLDYTIVAVKKTVNDFKKILYCSTVVMQLFYIAYLVYATGTHRGFFAINIALLFLSVGYLGFFVYASQNEVGKGVKRVGKKAYAYTKLVINLLSLGIMIFSLVSTAGNLTAVSLLFTVFMGILWVFQVLFQILVYIVESRARLIIDGLKIDFENIAKPVTATTNFFKKLTGKEIEEKEPIKSREYLDELVQERKTEISNSKLERKFLKKQQKADKKAQKLADKQARREKKQ